MYLFYGPLVLKLVPESLGCSELTVKYCFLPVQSFLSCSLTPLPLLCVSNNGHHRLSLVLYWYQLKKSTMWELWVKFYLGQNEDYSLGDSISESSEKLLPRGMGESQYMCDFSERGIHAIKHTFCRRLLLFVKNRCQRLWFWCFSWCEEIGLVKPFPENN